MATLWDYQNQLRKIAEHRTSGAEQEILAVYSSVLQRLQSIVGRYYTVYSNGEGTLSAADLRLAGQYKGFLQDVLRGLEQLSEPQQEAIRSAVESAYAVCYDGMAAAVKEAASGSTSLQNALHGLSASTPETVAHIVEHPMQKLTLSHVLQKKRRQITHKIRQTLSVGLANGDSYPQMANRIADALHGDYKKAIRVVRTEANRAINRGFQDVSEEAAHLLQGSEYLEVKEWCSAEDGDVRDAHRKLDGKVIPATEAFEIDGKKSQCPGGFGVAELDINCRCFLKYALVKREDFEKKHGKIKGETLTSEGAGGIIKKKTSAVSGALNPDSERADEHAQRYYAAVRKMKTDVPRIAQNTGFSSELVQSIKKFIFMEKHDLGDRIDYFDPDYKMAESWQRLIDGKDIKPHDLTLLRHEKMERELMKQGYSQAEAHKITSKTYNYAKEAYEYYDSIEKHKGKS